MINTMEKIVTLRPEKRGELTIDNFINSTELTRSDKIRLAVMKIRGSVIAIK
jgi:hypothetical protein